jgi:outer membrane protein assembly factor BamC
MNIRKKSYIAHCNAAQRGLFCAVALTALAGCSTVGSLFESDRLDYKSASKATAAPLDVPPDLTQLQRDSRYGIPGANSGVATASSYNLQQGTRPTAAASAVIAPKSTEGMRIERAGNQRWLVVSQPAEVLWPQIKEFWQDAGFVIKTEVPEAGVMETDWAENRAKIPQDILRRTLGRVIDSLYSTGERDKFRTRVERAPDGSTEIYISHRGAEEVLTGQQKEGTMWTARPSDPELEAEFIGRLMARLGNADTARTKEAVVAAAPQQETAKLVRSDGGDFIQIDESFDRAWRRVGLALDRIGFTVEDRDRAQGLYFVRYVDQGEEAQGKGNEKGFLSRLFSFGSDNNNAESAQNYRVSVKGNGASSQLTVLDKDGRAVKSAATDKILSLLSDQLK